MDPTDASTLERLVGSATFARGAGYAAQGRVLTSGWGDGGTRLVGMVQGAATAPYVATVTVARSAHGRLTRVSGTCTCPVGVNCKHVVALLLDAGDRTEGRDGGSDRPRLTLVGSDEGATPPAPAEPGRRGPRTRSAAARRTPATAWEAPLQALVSSEPTGGHEPTASDLGLQFELVATPSGRPPRSGGPTTGVRLRPVVRNHSRAWVRTGISWSRLDLQRGYGRRVDGPTAGHLRILSELLALSRLSNPGFRSSPSYASTDEAVWLQTVHSRRLWDLLYEARDLGLPMVLTGRAAAPVDLRPVPAAVTVDAARRLAGVELRPRVDVDGADVPLGTSLLLGEPAHGIAWWPAQDQVTGAATGLSLAPFEETVDDGVRGLLAWDVVTA
jgi:hypothetical protein